VIETSDLQCRETIEILNSVQHDFKERVTEKEHKPAPGRKHWAGQVLRGQKLSSSSGYEQPGSTENEHEPMSNHSLSVVLPAYNEEEIIARTVETVLEVLNVWGIDYEILVVNDGSVDRTGEIVAALVDANSHVRVVTHASNQGYGASLVSGFAAATKELVFFMDSDGQFDIRDLQRLFPPIDGYDAVIGYRVHRQDSWMRKLNAWGWKHLIGLVLGVHVRDVDCAFKLLHTEFLHQHPLETRGAMINAELLYRLKCAGCSYKEVGVNLLPRLHGQATGARLSVILRAFRELFVSARKWHREERGLLTQHAKRELQTGG
jgi:glycosyltransferase involved in cell wall biosynthesis